jgi:hypothetical protein
MFKAVRKNRSPTGIAMSKALLMLVLPVALAGCAMGHLNLQPMTLGPSDTPKSSCLTYDDSPAFGDCKGPGTVTIPRATE